ncbi:hypothetical protein [Klebsiella aerogenes]|uniref:hypothetical protein n=1 Tax=Klebsiella aerogenes TaxID=548 RepID=UPI0002AB635D|nr:hypothetical protein [Klebsiella aerogenes]AML34581.1 Hypothetical protein EAG7_00834 [Klebsiella aerogenes]MDU1745321.1 hypothetical protein [Klebsiella aerogenes]RXX24188.1 hypothetical protein CWC42_24145 [Klebsiella aerogenes]RXX28028.1 hypothetical protein CWC43_16180 [Klebsiella aerogenes]CCG29391.1 hypothetical protein [Klebsiella aerogenes EA1509E]
MNGTETKQVDYLYRGIIDYFSNISGLDITTEQIKLRDKFITESAIVCDDSLDAQVISLQDEFIAAGGNPEQEKLVIAKALKLLSL